MYISNYMSEKFGDEEHNPMIECIEESKDSID